MPFTVIFHLGSRFSLRLSTNNLYVFTNLEQISACNKDFA
jgi:hypothetical protein